MRRWLDRAKPGRSRQNVFCDGALMKVGSSPCALSGRDTELATPSRDPAKALLVRDCRLSVLVMCVGLLRSGCVPSTHRHRDTDTDRQTQTQTDKQRQAETDRKATRQRQHVSKLHSYRQAKRKPSKHPTNSASPSPPTYLHVREGVGSPGEAGVEEGGGVETNSQQRVRDLPGLLLAVQLRPEGRGVDVAGLQDDLVIRVVCTARETRW